MWGLHLTLKRREKSHHALRSEDLGLKPPKNPVIDTRSKENPTLFLPVHQPTDVLTEPKSILGTAALRKMFRLPVGSGFIDALALLTMKDRYQNCHTIKPMNIKTAKCFGFWPQTPGLRYSTAEEAQAAQAALDGADLWGSSIVVDFWQQAMKADSASPPVFANPKCSTEQNHSDWIMWEQSFWC